MKKKNLPAVVKPSKQLIAKVRRKVSKLPSMSRLESIIGDNAEGIQELLEVGDNDSATALIHKTMLQTLIDLVPYAEHNVRKSEGARGVYQINSLISSIREVVIDLQNLQDRGALGEALVDKIIRPTFLDIGMRIVESYSAIAMEAKDTMSAVEYDSFKKVLSDQRTGIAQYIRDEYMRVHSECKSFLQK